MFRHATNERDKVVECAYFDSAVDLDSDNTSQQEACSEEIASYKPEKVDLQTGSVVAVDTATEGKGCASCREVEVKAHENCIHEVRKNRLWVDNIQSTSLPSHKASPEILE
jgi:hypothetical protein